MQLSDVTCLIWVRILAENSSESLIHPWLRNHMSHLRTWLSPWLRPWLSA